MKKIIFIAALFLPVTSLFCGKEFQVSQFISGELGLTLKDNTLTVFIAQADKKNLNISKWNSTTLKTPIPQACTQESYDIVISKAALSRNNDALVVSMLLNGSFDNERYGKIVSLNPNNFKSWQPTACTYDPLLWERALLFDINADASKIAIRKENNLSESPSKVGIYDTKEKKYTSSYKTNYKKFDSLALYGETLLVGGDESVQLWNINNDELKKTIDLNGCQATAICAKNTDTKQPSIFAIACHDPEFNVNKIKLLNSTDYTDQTIKLDGPVMWQEVDGTGEKLALIENSKNHALKIIDVKTGKIENKIYIDTTSNWDKTKPKANGCWDSTNKALIGYALNNGCAGLYDLREKNNN